MDGQGRKIHLSRTCLYVENNIVRTAPNVVSSVGIISVLSKIRLGTCGKTTICVFLFLLHSPRREEIQRMSFHTPSCGLAFGLHPVTRSSNHV